MFSMKPDAVKKPGSFLTLHKEYRLYYILSLLTGHEKTDLRHLWSLVVVSIFRAAHPDHSDPPDHRWHHRHPVPAAPGQGDRQIRRKGYSPGGGGRAGGGLSRVWLFQVPVRGPHRVSCWCVFFICLTRRRSRSIWPCSMYLKKIALDEITRPANLDRRANDRSYLLDRRGLAGRGHLEFVWFPIRVPAGGCDCGTQLVLRRAWCASTSMVNTSLTHRSFPYKRLSDARFGRNYPCANQNRKNLFLDFG